ncbi:MAG TPA: hypothetical protein PLI45_03395 [Candidatus Woesebacteria bacterium]|nr:hypothetical protein [Candidatus Woesebacteria bacterium]
MKHLFITILFISSFFLFSSNSYAVGQVCCTPQYDTDGNDLGYKYEALYNACNSFYTAPGGYPSLPTNCSADEICSGSICVSNTNTTPTITTTITSTPIPTSSTCGNLNQDCCSPSVYVGGDTINVLYTCNNSSLHCIDQMNQPFSPGTCVDLSTPSHAPTVYLEKSKTSVLCADDKSINTALGCINVSSPQSFITNILRIATGIGGGIALALILYGVFIVTTSAGSPDKLKAGSEIITSAVVGLIFIILSIFIVNLIGINILGIPGLN